MVLFLSGTCISKQVLNVKIGALLDSQKSISVFKTAVQTNSEIDVGNTTLKFDPIAEFLSNDSIETANQVCDLMAKANGGLVSVIVSHPAHNIEEAPLAVSFTASYYNLSVVSVCARHSTFSDKYSHPTFLRTVPPYNQEAQIFARLIKFFKWKEIMLIRTTDDEGDMFFSRLGRASEDEQAFKIKHLKLPTFVDEYPFNPFSVMENLTKEQTRAVVFYSNSVIVASMVFETARRLQMFNKGWSWLVNENALRVHPLDLPPGIVGVYLRIYSMADHLRDAVNVVKFGVKRVAQSWGSNANRQGLNFTKDCESVETADDSGMLKQITDAISQANLLGSTGQVSFDRRGDREQAVYSILHVVTSYNSTKLITVGNCSIQVTEDRGGLTNLGSVSTFDLNVDMSLVKWPPGNTQYPVVEEVCEPPPPSPCSKKVKKKVYLAPVSFKKKTLLRIVTQESVPFVYTRNLTADKACKESDDFNKLHMEVPCNHTDPVTGITTQYCCSGYNIDLLRQLTLRPIKDILTPFSYSLHLVGDGQIGQNLGEGQWNGIVDELQSGKADLAVANMPITPERAVRIEFTKPFKYLGLTILVKRSLPKSNLVSFLQPFDYTLWVLVFLSVHVVALVLYLLDRFSPFGRFKLASSTDTEEDALNLASAMWFAWGVLLNSGIGEGTPRSFSARVLGMVWAGFAMIIVASYTANLAAFLVLDRPEALISGIDDARMRNPTKDFLFATVKNSPVELFFKRRLEYATMFRTMEQHTYNTVTQAIQAVKSGALNAFIWDSARLNYEASADCDLMTAGEVFGRFGYGLAMTKGSPWLREMSQAVLNFHELGVMERLDSEWILNKSRGCPPTDSLSPATLGLTNMAGVFIMVAAGIVAGVFLIFIEMAYKKRTGMKEKELELAKSAADRWRGNIEKRKVLRRGRAASHFGDLTPSNGGSPNTMFSTSNLTDPVSLDHKRSLHQFNN